jgi:hypothetical protein
MFVIISDGFHSWIKENMVCVSFNFVYGSGAGQQKSASTIL